MRGLIKNSEPVEQSNTQLKDYFNRIIFDSMHWVLLWLVLPCEVFLRSSHVSTSTLTSSKERWMGTDLSLVHWILTATRLQVALLSLSQTGSSSRSVRTSSFSSRFFSSPSPFNADRWIWSWDKFLANLKGENYIHRKMRAFITIRLLRLNCCM